MILCISVVSTVKSLLSISDFIYLSHLFFFLMSLAKICLLNLFKKPNVVSLIFSVVFLGSVLCIAALIFVISFLLLILCFIFSFF